MREKYLWLVIAALTALTLGQACYIYECGLSAKEIPEKTPVQSDMPQKGYSEKASDAQWAEFEKWRDRIHAEINRGKPLAERDFDAFFDERFFSRRPRPFDEMERIRRQMSDLFNAPEKSSFEEYWEKWFEQRLRMTQFRTELIRTGRELILEIYVPGLAATAADINITGERIRMSFSAKTSSGEKTAGGLIKKESSQNYVKILPVPAEAVAGTGRVEIYGDRVKIKFELK
ncbi:MAG: hypothetical protein A2X35_00810 [Elusimicrobia bacterium GWA2_61_42]|nr:MAG: hypothetical protein A2X35_00810 [Elusimicrobia bacterium GWA2_61_42]OGR75244.1 MAG: hypothetical protein A2X38_04975 [Elusimicrobia bacterium GWC2_61_25]